jgi:hypothetical protein
MGDWQWIDADTPKVGEVFECRDVLAEEEAVVVRISNDPNEAELVERDTGLWFPGHVWRPLT